MDLHDLLVADYDLRRYFISLPVNVQLTVHKRNEEIHSAEELHQYVNFLTKRREE